MVKVSRGFQNVDGHEFTPGSNGTVIRCRHVMDRQKEAALSLGPGTELVSRKKRKAETEGEKRTRGTISQAGPPRNPYCEFCSSAVVNTALQVLQRSSKGEPGRSPSEARKKSP